MISLPTKAQILHELEERAGNTWETRRRDYSVTVLREIYDYNIHFFWPRGCKNKPVKLHKNISNYKTHELIHLLMDMVSPYNITKYIDSVRIKTAL